MLRRNPNKKSIEFQNVRILLSFAIALLIAAAIVIETREGAAAVPSSGTLSEANPVLMYDAGPFNVPNQSPVGLGQVDQGPRCNAQFPCDNFALTVSVPPGYAAQHPNASVNVTLYWTDAGTRQSDYDLYIYRGAVATLSGDRQADYQAASQSNPEVTSITPLADGNNTYSVKIVPYIPTQEIVHVRMELLPGTGGGGFPGFGGADPTVPGAPRYQVFVPPPGSTAETSNGEFNIGFNPRTGRIMAMNRGPIWRLTTPERQSPAKPECCEARWEDVTNLTTLEGVDPILWTDRVSGRTFASNSTAGTNVVYGFTDNDGDLWNPLSLSGPNASTDHETIGSGPLPASLSALITPLNQGQAVYYCAQTWPVGAAACQRSDTLGASYGPSVVVYDGQTSQCSFIHGHVRVGPDGTVYLPVRDCNGNAGLMVSTDGGVTWTERIIPNSKTQTHGSDPSVAIGANNTLYFFYVADQTSNPEDPSEGHIHVQVSRDRGATWSKDTDLGISHGIKNATFPEAIAGDDNRAAVGFLGTDRPGDFEGASFPGLWYLFIASTYDGGDSWTIVNATPNDPVQGVGGIWLGGGSNDNRNLLDFNEVTMDDKGRVVFGFSDGCVGNCVGDPSHNSYTAHMRVARQFGGKSLRASFDSPEPSAPKPSCLSGTRDSAGSHLFWKVPDNGGADIVNYQILRGLTPGSEVLIGQTGGPKASYQDTTADPAVGRYFYVVKAINSSGTGPVSNDIDLTIAATPTPTPTPTPAPCGTATTYPNAAVIQTNDGAIGSPYPSQINVSGLTGNVTKVTIGLTGLNHTYPDDVDILLVGPGGQNVVILSDVGGNIPASNVNLTLDDDAIAPLLDNGPLVSGRFKPTNVDTSDVFPSPAPTPSTATAVSAFNGTNPNGTWSLYVLDDTNLDGGTLTGWSLSIITDCSSATPTPTPSPTPANPCLSSTQVLTDVAGDQQDPVLPQPGATQLDIRSLNAGEDYRYLNSERLAFKLKVDNLNTIPARAVWRVLFDFTPPGGTVTTYYVAMNSDANSAISYEYGTQSGNLLTTLGNIEEGFYSSDGTVTLTLAMNKVGDANGRPGAGAFLNNVNAQTEQATDVGVGTLFSTVDSTNSVSYTVGPRSVSCTPVQPPQPPGSANYIKGGITFSPNYALRAPVASRDGEPSLRVDRFGNAYVAGIRGVPAGVDLWHFDLNPSSPTYDPYMRNPIYRGQPDQFSPDEAMEVGADGGGDVDLAVGFDAASPGQPPYLAFSSLVLANVSTARSTDRGATFTQNPVGSTTGGVPVDDRQWMEFYGRDSVYLLYRTVAPVIAYVQRSNDGGLTYGPARVVGTVGQVGGIDVDQNDGTVYVSGNSGVVAVGIPPATGLEPLTYTVHNVAGAGRANIFFTVKVANDGTVYVCYSDGRQVFIRYSRDKGTNWSPEIRISDGAETATSLLPWMETGQTPGSIGVVWYGTTATSNSDDANWKVFFAQSTDITAQTPTIRQVEVSDHFIHGSNISLAGLPLNPTTPSGNRNLIDYFQIGFDPTGAAVIAFTDDHNDFDGHTYVARQISGPSVNGGTIPAPVEGSNLPPQSPGPNPSAQSVGGLEGSQVTDYRHDVRTQTATLDVDDPFDVVSVKYTTEGPASDPLLVATMKVSELATIPPNGTWRINFTANAPGAAVSTTGDYNFGLSDRGDQFFLRATTDATGNQAFVYGTAARRHFVAGGGGGFDYVDKGPTNSGSIDASSDTITMKVSLSRLNSALPVGHTPLGPGSVLAGLRGGAFIAVQGTSARSDVTRGGTIARINSAPTAVLNANPTSGTVPLAISLDGSGSSDPDSGDTLSYTFNFGDGSAPVTQSNAVVAHTYTQVGRFTASLTVRDQLGFTSQPATVEINVIESPPTVDCMEDDDVRIGYSNGWHKINNVNASAGHFRLHNGSSSNHSALVRFTVGANRIGTFTYRYAKSSKGGRADVFIDGVSRGFVNFNGNGSDKFPEFGSGGVPYEVRYEGLTAGQHIFELRNMTDSVLVDGFCLQTVSQPQAPPGGGGSTSWSDSGATSTPGETTSNDSNLLAGQLSASMLNLGSTANEISVMAQTNAAVPIRLALVDPVGLTVQTVDAVNGVAVINAPVSRSGIYSVRVLNVGLGPVQVWSVATPMVSR